MQRRRPAEKKERSEKAEVQREEEEQRKVEESSHCKGTSAELKKNQFGMKWKEMKRAVKAENAKRKEIEGESEERKSEKALRMVKTATEVRNEKQKVSSQKFVLRRADSQA